MGLVVQALLHDHVYETGRKVPDDVRHALNLQPDALCPHWNYTCARVKATATPASCPQIGKLLFDEAYVYTLSLQEQDVWILLTKARRPGREPLLPFYNTYLLLKITGHSGWWVLLLCIPFLNIVLYINWMIDRARSYGRGTGVGIGLLITGADLHSHPRVRRRPIRRSGRRRSAGACLSGPNAKGE